MAERNQSQLRADFEILARDVSPSLMNLASRLCPYDHDTAQDLVQHTLVQAYIQLVNGKLNLEPGTKNWLKRALTNEFLQRIRKDKRLRFDNESLALVESPISETVARMDSEVRRNEIDSALELLSPDHRAVIVLIDLQDHDYHEAAEILRVPIGTIRSRLARARIKMAEAFQITKRGQTS